jgi:hypothetical protein
MPLSVRFGSGGRTGAHRWFRQDVAAKIVAFATQSSRAVCVLSAMGSVSRAVLRHPADGSPMARVHASPQPYNNSPAIYEVRATNPVEFRTP